jgi:hypothetical protein
LKAANIAAGNCNYKKLFAITIDSQIVAAGDGCEMKFQFTILDHDRVSTDFIQILDHITFKVIQDQPHMPGIAIRLDRQCQVVSEIKPLYCGQQPGKPSIQILVDRVCKGHNGRFELIIELNARIHAQYAAYLHTGWTARITTGTIFEPLWLSVQNKVIYHAGNEELASDGMGFFFYKL